MSLELLSLIHVNESVQIVWTDSVIQIIYRMLENVFIDLKWFCFWLKKKPFLAKILMFIKDFFPPKHLVWFICVNLFKIDSVMRVQKYIGHVVIYIGGCSRNWSNIILSVHLVKTACIKRLIWSNFTVL